MAASRHQPLPAWGPRNRNSTRHVPEAEPPLDENGGDQGTPGPTHSRVLSTPRKDRPLRRQPVQYTTPGPVSFMVGRLRRWGLTPSFGHHHSAHLACINCILRKFLQNTVYIL